MIIVDVETTGLDPKRHSIISIAGIDFDKPSERFYTHCRIFEGAEISPEALRINGETVESITHDEQSTEANAVQKFFRWVAGRDDWTVAGENPRFDLDFIRAAAERFGGSCNLGYRTVDLHTLTYAHHLKRCIPVPLKNLVSGISADYTYRYVGLPEHPLPHRSWRCSEMAAEAFSRLLYGENLLPEFAEYPIPRYLK